MNPWDTWKGKLEVASFLPSKYLDRQCALGASALSDNGTIVYDQVCNYVEGLQNVLFLVD